MRWQVAEPELGFGVVVEIVKPEALKVRYDDVLRPIIWRQARKVIERLRVRGVQIRARALVFGKHRARPEDVDAAGFGVARVRELLDLLLVHRHAAALDAEDLEEFAPEGLRLRALGNDVFPVARERGCGFKARIKRASVSRSPVDY
jgi:hypothetical protein